MGNRENLENLSYRLNQLSYEIFACADLINDLYDKEYHHYHGLRGTAKLIAEWSRLIEIDVNGNTED